MLLKCFILSGFYSLVMHPIASSIIYSVVKLMAYFILLSGFKTNVLLSSVGKCFFTVSGEHLQPLIIFVLIKGAAWRLLRLPYRRTTYLIHLKGKKATRRTHVSKNCYVSLNSVSLHFNKKKRLSYEEHN